MDKSNHTSKEGKISGKNHQLNRRNITEDKNNETSDLQNLHDSKKSKNESYINHTNGKTNTSCTICLDHFYIRAKTDLSNLSTEDKEVYDKGEPICTPCFHLYHAECIKKYLSISYENYRKYSMDSTNPFKCPDCKTVITNIKDFIKNLNNYLSSIDKYDFNNANPFIDMEEFDNSVNNDVIDLSNVPDANDVIHDVIGDVPDANDVIHDGVIGDVTDDGEIPSDILSRRIYSSNSDNLRAINREIQEMLAMAMLNRSTTSRRFNQINQEHTSLPEIPISQPIREEKTFDLSRNLFGHILEPNEELLEDLHDTKSNINLRFNEEELNPTVEISNEETKSNRLSLNNPFVQSSSLASIFTRIKNGKS
jgi:hypothetical protein